MAWGCSMAEAGWTLTGWRETHEKGSGAGPLVFNAAGEFESGRPGAPVSKLQPESDPERTREERLAPAVVSGPQGERSLEQSRSWPGTMSDPGLTADPVSSGSRTDVAGGPARAPSPRAFRQVGPVRQAVLVIHGMGQQKPMDTIRGFAEAVLPEPSPGTQLPKFFSKPEDLSGLYELRCLTAPQSRERPITDFFEFYWAYHVKGTKFRDLWQWLQQLLFRWPRDVPNRLRPLWYVAWLSIVVAAAVSIARYQTYGSLRLGDLNRGLVLWLASILLVPLIQGFALNYLGDAARYLSAFPTNVSLRHNIRASGLALLRHLHRSGRYDRIIVVGHSLGGVIGYDLLNLFWQETRRTHCKPSTFRQEALDQARAFAFGSHLEPQAFRMAQQKLWLEQRSLGNQWLVTDFVTLGSPLAHALLLLARSGDQLRQKIYERELTTCPPVAEIGVYKRDRATYVTSAGRRTIRFLHHAAPFACTRWTNLYFRSDFVGGPVGPLFGEGIADSVLAPNPGLIGHSPLAHTRYWRKQRGAITPAIVKLREVLGLECRRWLRFETTCTGAQGGVAGIRGKDGEADPGEDRTNS